VAGRDPAYQRARVPASQARVRAERAPADAARQERGWARARAAPAWFRPDGRPNDRAGAGGPVQAALPDLAGRWWQRVSQSGLARYYLRALENQAAEASVPARVNREQFKVTLEHILPQTPSGAWAHFAGDAVRVYWNRIGNLALLKEKDNSDAGSDDFQTVKVPSYRKAAYFKLTRELAKHKGLWDEEQIEKRQKRLAALAVKMWPITVK
jgi:Protein of unknown function (DUF1524)